MSAFIPICDNDIFFRKYLEKAGVLELLTKSLVQLYEEPQKPDDALTYLKKAVQGTLHKILKGIDRFVKKLQFLIFKCRLFISNPYHCTKEIR